MLRANLVPSTYRSVLHSQRHCSTEKSFNYCLQDKIGQSVPLVSCPSCKNCHFVNSFTTVRTTVMSEHQHWMWWVTFPQADYFVMELRYTELCRIAIFLPTNPTFYDTCVFPSFPAWGGISNSLFYDMVCLILSLYRGSKSSSKADITNEFLPVLTSTVTHTHT